MFLFPMRVRWVVFFLLATALPRALPAQSVSFCDVPTALPRDTTLPNYSPVICFQHAGLQSGNYNLRVWLLETDGFPDFQCASTQWCDRTFTIDNSGGTNGAAQRIVVEPMDVYGYNGFLWVARIFNAGGSEIASSQQAAISTTNRAPVLAPVGDRTGTSGQPLEFFVSAADAENNPFSLSAANLPPGATFDPALRKFSWPTPAAGTYAAVRFKVTQTSPVVLSDAESITIQIDAPAQALAFAAASFKAGEAGPAVVVVTRTGGSAGTVGVTYATSNGSAGAGSDYVSTTGSLSFAPGVTRATFTVTLVGDAAAESTESFTVTLSAPSGGATLGEPHTAPVTIVDDDTPAVSGQWGPVLPWPVVPIHMALLPSGKVMFWDRHDDANGWNGDPRVWDPDTQSIATLALPGYDLFCSGHSFLDDGKLLVTGGHLADGVGESKAGIYDSVVNSWSPATAMNAGRWYPTNTTLANGDVLVLAGTSTGYGHPNPMPQVWQAASTSWRDLTTALQGGYPEWADFYPFLYQAPNWKVFTAGPQRMARYLDTQATGSWSDVAASGLLYRDYGSSVMYGSRVLILGGNPREAPETIPTILPSDLVEVIDLADATPAWRSVTPLSAGRRHLNSTLLPDGKVLVTGGSSLPGFDNPAGGVSYTEMWDPSTETWTILAGHARYRGYHSNALLLPDGRVLVGGGGHPDPAGGSAQPNVEIYSPPYLFRGPRPTITSAPQQVLYGQTFFVGTSSPQSVAAVNLLRLGAVTHAFNQNQRLVDHLSFTPTTGGISVTAPAVGLSPGHYMLFLLDGNGVPSVARVLRLGAQPLPTLSVTLAGPGVGGVVSSPPGIACASDCSEIYANGTEVTLTPTPGGGSTFVGWSGDADCSNGVVTMLGDRSCIATFGLASGAIFADGFESGGTSAWLRFP